MREKKDVFLILRLSKSLKEKLVELSKKQKKSISKIAREILLKHFND